MDDDQFKEEVVKRLDLITRLLALNINPHSFLKDKNQGEQIRILSDLGLSRNIIALIVGTTPEVVSVRLSQMKSVDKTKPWKD